MPSQIPWGAVTKYLSGVCSKEDEKSLRSWMAENPQNVDFVNSLKKIWDRSPSSPETVDVDRIVNGVMRQIQDSQPKGALSLHNKLHDRFSRLLAFTFVRKIVFAAAVLVILGISGMTYWSIFGVTSEESSHEFLSRRGEKIVVTLKDDTRVWLSPDTRLVLTIDKNGQEAFLSGQAYFDVMPGRPLPFVIETKSARVEVLGTGFNIKAWPEGPTTEVEVVRGSVFVRGIAQDLRDGIILRENQRTAVTNNGIGSAIQEIQGSDYASWIDGKLVFRNEKLSEVAETLSRWYDIDITFGDQDLKSKHLTATFQHEGIEEIVNLIATTLGVSYNRTGRHFEFEGQTN